MVRWNHLFALGSAAVAASASATDNTTTTDVPQVVVTATFTERLLDDAPASMSVVTREALNNRPVQDLADALIGVPGVNVGGVGLARRGISIRGMSNEYTLTLLDGKRISQTAGIIGHSEADVGWIPTEGIERIEVVRGPMSSLYGSDALGGVVNIITRTATDAWRASLTSRGEWREDGRGGDVFQTGLYAGGPLIQDQLGITAYGEFRDRKATPGPVNPLLSEMEGREVTSGNIALNWTPDESQRIELAYGRGEEERARDTQQTGATRYFYNSIDDIERQQFSLSHAGKWRWGETTVRAYGTTLEKSNRRSQGVPTRPQELEDRTLDARTTLPVGEINLLSVGTEWREEELHDTAMNAAGYDSAIHKAAFLQDEIQLGKWLFVVGDRLDNHEQFGNQHSPRGYVVYRLSDALTVKGGVGRGFKAPSLKLLSPTYSVTTGTFVVFGNPNLEPEVSTSYEIGTHFRARGWSLQATAFQNDVDDLIQSFCAANCDALRVLNYENVDQARIRGVELGSTVDLLPRVALDLNYTYLDAKDRGADRPLAEKPKHSSNVRLGWSPNAQFTAELRGNYYGKQTLYSSEVRYELPDYTLWGIDLNYQLTTRFKLHLSGDNLGDEQLAERSTRFTYVEPGRSYSIGFTGTL